MRLNLVLLRRAALAAKQKMYAIGAYHKENKVNYKNYLKKITDSAKDNTDERDELEKTLTQIDSEKLSKPNLPETEYERKTYELPSDKQLSDAAKAELSDYLQTSIKNIDKTAADKAAAAQSTIDSTLESQSREATSIKGSYAEAAEELANDALKRGIARSSIAANNAAMIRSAEAEALVNSAAEAESRVRQLESEIAALGADRAAALDEFNITYAAKLTEKINELTAESEKKREEVIEYNNTIAEKERVAANEKAKLESQLYEDALDAAQKENELKSQTMDAVYKQKYAAIKQYLDGLGADAAKKAVTGDELIRGSLSDYYYYQLYNDYVK